MGGKLRETNDEARTFAIGNKSLASLFVHTPAGKIFVHCPGSYHVLKLAPDLYLCHTAKNSLYQHLLYGDVYLVGQPVIFGCVQFKLITVQLCYNFIFDTGLFESHATLCYSSFWEEYILVSFSIQISGLQS